MGVLLGSHATSCLWRHDRYLGTHSLSPPFGYSKMCEFHAEYEEEYDEIRKILTNADTPRRKCTPASPRSQAIATAHIPRICTTVGPDLTYRGRISPKPFLSYGGKG